MITVCYSTVLDHDIQKSWSLIRDFNNYPVYIEGVSESVIEDELPGDEVGAVRRFCYGGAWLRQRLGAHSDELRSLTYVGLSPFAYPEGLAGETPPPASYQGTMHLMPVVEGDRTFIEWSVSVDAAPAHEDSWRTLLNGLIRDWTGSLQRTLDRPDREVRDDTAAH